MPLATALKTAAALDSLKIQRYYYVLEPSFNNYNNFIISRQPSTLVNPVSLPAQKVAVVKKRAAIASKKATAAAQSLQEAAEQPTVVSAIDATEQATNASNVAAAIAAEPTTSETNVAAVEAFIAVTSAVRRGRPPGSTNRPPSKTTSQPDVPGHPKGPGHEQFPLLTWSLTISRVSKNSKANDVPPELLENVQVFFDDFCVRGNINCVI